MCENPGIRNFLDSSFFLDSKKNPDSRILTSVFYMQILESGIFLIPDFFLIPEKKKIQADSRIPMAFKYGDSYNFSENVTLKFDNRKVFNNRIFL
jgi:hypothetical protein